MARGKGAEARGKRTKGERDGDICNSVNNKNKEKKWKNNDLFNAKIWRPNKTLMRQQKKLKPTVPPKGLHTPLFPKTS